MAEIAYRVYVRGDAADPADRAAIRAWAVERFGAKAPTKEEICYTHKGVPASRLTADSVAAYWFLELLAMSRTHSAYRSTSKKDLAREPLPPKEWF